MSLKSIELTFLNTHYTYKNARIYQQNVAFTCAVCAAERSELLTLPVPLQGTIINLKIVPRHLYTNIIQLMTFFTHRTTV